MKCDYANLHLFGLKKLLIELPAICVNEIQNKNEPWNAPLQF